VKTVFVKPRSHSRMNATRPHGNLPHALFFDEADRMRRARGPPPDEEELD
jgi:hypothetical protein